MLVVHRLGYGWDTLCTHALMRQAVNQLPLWGLRHRSGDAAFRGEYESFARPILATTDAVSGFDWSLQELRKGTGAPARLPPIPCLSVDRRETRRPGNLEGHADRR